MNGSVRFALLTVRIKNGTVTVAVKKRYGAVRYGTDTVRYGTDTVAVTNSDALL